MTPLERAGRCVGFAVVLGLAAQPVAAQQELAQLDRPRFMQPVPGSRTPEEVDVTRVPILRRRVSLDRQGATVGGVLREITRQTGLRFAYNADALSLDRAIELRAASVTVGAALTEILIDTGVDVLLKSPSQAVLLRRNTARRAGTFVGRVTDAKTGQAVPTAEVFLHDTRWRAITDTAGRYRLVDVDSGAYTLIARKPGYAKVTRAVTVREGQEDTVDIAMTIAAVKLDELVTTATGRQRRRDLGNAITTIKPDSVMRTAPIRSLTDLLENRVPGMSLQHTSGAPGDPARIRLRGLSSVLRGNDPVVVVDGVRIYSAQSETRSGNLTNLAVRNDADTARFGAGNTPAPSPLDQIDPNIIETIEVFKGPSAATLYGADAANGVIVITTKKGKPGPTRWSGSAIYGRTTPAGEYPTAYFRWGHVPVDGNATEFCPVIYVRCVADSLVRYQALNDPDMTILGRGSRAAASLTASGGSQALTYSVTGSYSDETGLLRLPAFEVARFQQSFNRAAPDWMRRPHRLKEWSVASNVTALLGPTADLTLSTKLSSTRQQRTSLESRLAPLARTYVDKVTGTLYTSLRSAPVTGGNSYVLNRTAAVSWDYPLADYYRRTTASTLAFTTGLNAGWHPRSWFNATAQAGVNVMPRDDETLLPSGLIKSVDSGALVRGTGRALESTFNLHGQVRRPLKWGFVFETSAGADLVTRTVNDLVSSASGLLPGTSSLTGATHIEATDSRASTSVFGWFLEPRISGQRLSLSTGLRLDGGSNYGTRITGGGGGGLLGLLALPKLNGSWVISEEPWFPFQSLFSSLRLRGAYGQAQVQPDVGSRLRLYKRRVDGQGELLDLTTLGNTDLRPERSTEVEGGFDTDMLDGRLSVELTGYRKVQVDALMAVNLPTSVNGGGTVIRNIGNIRNTGLEITGRIIPIRAPALTWSATLNYSSNTNTLVKLGSGVEPNPATGTVEGYPVGGRWSRPILGFVDRNGDGIIEAGEVQIGESMTYMGSLYPAYQTSLSTDVALLGNAVHVTADFSYDAGATQIDETAKNNWVLSRALVDPSTPPDQQAAVIVNNITDYGLTQTVSTFRFNSFAVTYQAPAPVARLVGARQLSLSLQGKNLGLHTSYRGKDPDVSAWSPTERIVDTGQLALPRTWQLALHIDY